MNQTAAFEINKWRLVISQPARGAWNMAVDEAILESVILMESLPTLRLYAWDPACLSLGFSQSLTDVNVDAINKHGWEITRRITGGRAILHTDELTYSVIGLQTESRLKGGVMESYRTISGALLRSLELLGVPAVAQAIKVAELDSTVSINTNINLNPVCFEVPSNYEITVNRKKLVGSAQARRKIGVLQHGSIPLSGDITRITRILNFPDEDQQIQAGKRLFSRATTIEQVLNKQIGWDAAADALQVAFSEVLNIQFVEIQLSTDEIKLAENLVKEKYDSQDWISRV